MSGGLRERLGRLTKSAAVSPRPAEPVVTEKHDEPEAEAWGKLGFALRSGPGGACFVREVQFGPTHQHGLFRIMELAGVGDMLQRLDPTGRIVEPEKLLFLDTETTGLGQGAGNVPFLIGVGWWKSGGFTVRQYVIRHPGEEAAMLAMLADLLPQFTHLVTYNGRSFDWPLVKNRFVMHRLSMPKDPLHFDFLYPARALWRTTMPSCRLGVVEEAKLGVIREEDVPGSLVPALYFQYLAERDVTVLEGVFQHNENDILTLLSLAIHLGRLLVGGMDNSTLSPAELLRLALWYERLGFIEEAESVMAELASRPVSEAVVEHSEAAQYYKRYKRWEEAVRMWRGITGHASGRRLVSLEPYIELSMAYEHRLKDLNEALYWAEEALRSAELRLSLSRAGGDGKLREQLQDIRKRRARLIKKRMKEQERR